MKKIYVLTVCLLLLILSSCEFSETIHINENGAGTMSFSFDGSQLMQMGGESMGTDEKVLDSTVVFKDFLEAKKDSIATLPKDEQERLKALENFKMHMLMDPKTQKMVIDINTDFENVEELEDMFKVLNKANELKETNEAQQTSPLAKMGATESSEVSYTYKGNVFKRIVTVVNPELLESTKDSLADAEMILAASTYTLNYHFPKKIKSVSLENAMFSADHKSFSAELSFKEYMTNPESLNVEVILED
ncbi:hypothetical protein [Formosa algae]|uniref:Lipoprotein n=1 Tax=Formosa algae TaxID=225843 RepID=A0A9X1C874_9FLAO|nr:hypothetical protein [Formosa algae]MBP1838113.1 hypothetical protein [Formosa algae]MDQ0334248.1 hypothetical protein [Formosa algae]OEI80104.1 hypothetical protein AST99_11150 [Formosa algae]